LGHDIPRLVIGAPASGSGKTTITCGLLAALAREHVVQGYKVGPDYIDPGYHTAATGRVARNLDTWMVDPGRIQQSFALTTQGADIAIIEGVMGLFDGYDALTERGSTAEVAKLLQAPVILVIDAAKMARSAAAIAKGFCTFSDNLNVGGGICNNVGSARHADLVTQAIEATGIPVLGCLPRNANLHTPSRHLGLHTALERQAGLDAFMQQAAASVCEHIDLARVWALAKSAPALTAIELPALHSAEISVRLAVARDEAFCFYYEDNFDHLRAAGADLVMFSPLRDQQLPEDIAGIYLGGGYPELYAAQLAANCSMLDALRAAIGSGMPTYAECGGLMVLTEGIVDAQGESHAMLGLLSGYAVMGERVRLGYRTVTALCDSILLEAGETVRGHEFHYSDWIRPDDGLSAAYDVAPRQTDSAWQTGLCHENLLASYVHLHFGTHPPMAERFVQQCRAWWAQQGRTVEASAGR
jgi:cobyrinic acid a,c-diamide synthase